MTYDHDTQAKANTCVVTNRNLVTDRKMFLGVVPAFNSLTCFRRCRYVASPYRTPRASPTTRQPAAIRIVFIRRPPSEDTPAQLPVR